MLPNSIKTLMVKFSLLPGVGPKTAGRYVFSLLKLSQREIDDLAKNILALKKEIKTCELCFNFFSNESNLCQICGNPKRDKSLILVAEKETDIEPIEKIKRYNGLYFILGGTIFKQEQINLKDLRIKELELRIKNACAESNQSDKNLKEIILGFNPTIEGDATALYLKKQIQTWVGDKIKITRLGRGLPIGGELEYADEETLSQALDNRR